MTERSHLRRLAISLVVATLGFAAALALRERINPWQSTALASAASILLALWALGPRVRALFAITSRGTLVAVALGAALVVATHVGFHLVTRISPELAATVRTLYASVDVGGSRLALALLTTIVVIGEELVWRGVAVELLEPGRSRLHAGAISVALYVVPQLVGGVPLLILAASLLGALFALQRLVTTRLADPLITHAIWSVSVFVVFPLVG